MRLYRVLQHPNHYPLFWFLLRHHSVLVPAGTGAARLHLDASIDQFASEDRPCWPRPVQVPSLGGAVPSWFLRGQALCARSSIARTGL